MTKEVTEVLVMTHACMPMFLHELHAASCAQALRTASKLLKKAALRQCTMLVSY